MAADSETGVLGRYRLHSRLGEGGMASVYRASPLDGGEQVAVKVLEPAGARQETARQRFVREIFTLATLSHPHIVPVVDYGEARGRLYYAMPLLEGGTLEHRLRGNRRLPVSQVARLAEDLLEALRYLHARGFLHRDIKPANVMFDAQGRAVLMDFGLVKPEKGSNLTRTGRVLGTPRYMPPEVLKSGDVDVTSDLYQVGLVTYQAATGGLPYGEDALLGMLELAGDSITPLEPSSLNPALPRELVDFLLNAVEWRRDCRYPDAEAMLEDLGRARDGSPVARRGRTGGKPSRPLLGLLKPGAVAERYELAAGARLAPGVEYLEGRDLDGAAVLLRPMPPLAGAEEDALKVLAPFAGVQHPALGRIRDFVVHGGRAFLVFERPPGFGFLEPPTGHDSWPRERAVQRVLGLVEGLEALHARRQVHGDVTLQNVMVDEAGAVKLLGLGSSALREAGLLARPPGDSTARVNTWMAPEQHDGRAATAAADVYAAGRLLSLLVHGRLLPAASQAEANSSESDPLLQVIARATAWNPTERYAGAAQLAAALRRATGLGRRVGGRFGRAGAAIRKSVSTLAVRLSARGDGSRARVIALGLAATAVAVAAAILLR
ncbi:MAG: protein kinase [Candidatus Wallbacteria bacterium]|nr:protein kinase [Candidatus Wallbacteria bacterium]